MARKQVLKGDVYSNWIIPRYAIYNTCIMPPGVFKKEGGVQKSAETKQNTRKTGEKYRKVRERHSHYGPSRPATWLERANHREAENIVCSKWESTSSTGLVADDTRTVGVALPSSRRSRRPRCGLYFHFLLQCVIFYIQLRYHTHDTSYNFNFPARYNGPRASKRYTLHLYVCIVFTGLCARRRGEGPRSRQKVALERGQKKKEEGGGSTTNAQGHAKKE